MTQHHLSDNGTARVICGSIRVRNMSQLGKQDVGGHARCRDEDFTESGRGGIDVNF